jgi:hypothetical protein
MPSTMELCGSSIAQRILAVVDVERKAPGVNGLISGAHINYWRVVAGDKTKCGFKSGHNVTQSVPRGPVWSVQGQHYPRRQVQELTERVDRH